MEKQIENNENVKSGGENMINELIEDKTKLEENILELLKEFQKKYPKIIFEDINFGHKLERKLNGDIAINEISKVVLELKI